jgi:hypothetical protein
VGYLIMLARGSIIMLRRNLSPVKRKKWFSVCCIDTVEVDEGFGG